MVNTKLAKRLIYKKKRTEKITSATKQKSNTKLIGNLLVPTV